MSRQSFIRSCIPENYDLQLAEARGLAADGIFSQEYFALQDAYCASLARWLKGAAILHELEAQLRGHALGFIPAAEPVNIYQAHCPLGLQFFFLRSHLCIERLSPQQLDILRSESAIARDALVRSTLAEVAKFQPDLADDARIAIDPSGRIVPNRCLALGFAMEGKLNDDGCYADPLHEEALHAAIRGTLPQVAEALSEQIGLPVSIFPY